MRHPFTGPVFHIPAACPKCGAISQSGIIIPVHAKINWVSLAGNKTICRICGEEADTIDGEFGWSDEKLKVFSAPTWSLDVLRELKILLEIAKSETEPRLQILEKISAVSPEIGGMIRPYIDAKKIRWSVIIGVILGMIVQRMEFKIDVKIDINKTIDQAREILSEDANKPHDDTDNKSSNKSAESAHPITDPKPDEI
jgi:hypothetical protein